MQFTAPVMALRAMPGAQKNKGAPERPFVPWWANEGLFEVLDEVDEIAE
jgi:hypothetical protein